MKDWTAKQVQNAPPGRHRVSQSLYLEAKRNKRGKIIKRFAFRYTKPSTGKVTEKSLGSVDLINLKKARDRVLDLRRMVANGEDPMRGVTTSATTFADVATEYIETAACQYRNPGSARNARHLLMTHAASLAAMPVNTIDAAAIKTALSPLRQRSPDAAQRTVAAILRVLVYAKALDYETASVGDLREHMRHLFPRTNGAKQHFTALPYAEIPTLFGKLHIAQTQADALSPYAIEFLILTAARENEVCGMKFGEIDWENKVWIVPAERMKAGREHRVPLCDRALALLKHQRRPGPDPETPETYVWRGRIYDQPVTGKAIYKYLTQTMDINATIHGFPATFRTWCGNETNFDRVTCELALSHAAGDGVELAYRRGDELTKRRALMAAWESYCSGASGR
jgi:integrase